MRSKAGIRMLTWFLSLLLMAPPGLGAQQLSQEQGTGAAQSSTYTQEQLDRLLAPIALYPDTLLSQILMASTPGKRLTDRAQGEQRENLPIKEITKQIQLGSS